MSLIIAPAIDGLKKEWPKRREHGASSAQFWRYIALPVLMPRCSARDPAVRQRLRRTGHGYQLTGGFINLVTILIGTS